MMNTIRALIRMRRIDRLIKHLKKAATLAEKAGLNDKIAFDIDRVTVSVAASSVRIADEFGELNKGIAA